MHRRILFLLGSFVLFPIVLLALIIYSLYLLHENGNNYNKSLNILEGNIEFRALPEERAQSQIFIVQTDIRTATLKDFLEIYKSPLLTHANTIVENADKYNLDFRLLPAIAMQESNLCKKMPKDSYNCWGFGIYGKKITRFSDYNQAIDTVSRTLSKQYIQKGLKEPEEIMKKYTPSSNGSWAESVAYFMDKLKIETTN